ncbi:MAG: hypothetical protein KKE39_06125 [Bacteroidetes bacterium]|nr:hypothetical protein [Bacteroidota bacterium]MBU1373511.1 hypothetical protein [Bacteroidota bacterium]MBU1485269.1 hypothetical protein [Bacteroidota bacterium]MBU1760170.1 hypothetical protein [Bacteroidota bacterium]MBU2045593.1 hypothetical protein [Bacteroidota bacterium]
MMQKYRLLFSILFLGLGLVSCNSFNQTEKPIAKAYDKYLYPKDLEGVVSKNTHGNDSLSVVKAFIDQWLHEQVMQHQAEENVNIDGKYIQTQLENYRKSLIRFQYEQELIKQKLDTVVSGQEIKAFYAANQDNFQLKKPILKVSYIKLPKDAPKVNMVKKLFTSRNIRDQDLLEKYCFKYSPNFSLMDTIWHYTDELEKIFPISKIGENNYDNLNRIFQISENNTLYLIILRDSKFRDSLSPLGFEKENIKNLILNQRKLALINSMEMSVFNEAQKNNELEIYDK